LVTVAVADELDISFLIVTLSEKVLLIRGLRSEYGFAKSVGQGDKAEFSRVIVISAATWIPSMKVANDAFRLGYVK
jgi:hypothetical protein